MYFNNAPRPSYSLYDLCKDLCNGVKDTFTYNEVAFKVKRKGLGYIITSPEGFEGYTPYVGAMVDFQGVAACLLAEKRNLKFDREGNFID